MLTTAVYRTSELKDEACTQMNEPLCSVSCWPMHKSHYEVHIQFSSLNIFIIIIRKTRCSSDNNAPFYNPTGRPSSARDTKPHSLSRELMEEWLFVLAPLDCA